MLAINQAFADYTQNTCITFQKRTTETAYVSFFKGSGSVKFNTKPKISKFHSAQTLSYKYFVAILIYLPFSSVAGLMLEKLVKSSSYRLPPDVGIRA